MVYRVYVSKKTEYAGEDRSLFNDLKSSLGIKGLRKVKVYNRYDIEGVDKETFETAVQTIFSEPQVDDVTYSIKIDDNTFATELLPGQFDQRADSAQQCVQFVTGGNRPTVKYARVIKLYGHVTKEELEKIQKHIINPVESRLASLEKPKTLETIYPLPEKTPVIEGFVDMDKAAFGEFIKQYGLAMDADDLAFCQDYFKDQEKRNPTLTELRMIDTYWSDHCRHTTFNTILDEVTIEHEAVKASYEKYLAIKEELYPNKNRPLTLMDLATVGAKYLKRTGKLKNLDESEEINACSVKINVKLDDGSSEKWLLMFKNETHNHPTEIEPFGGAATCLGGAIRDPLSGRSYVYQAMRLTGAGNPLAPLSETLEGKLPQSKICQTAAAGYSSYGNQIGLATGLVDEIYHDGYVAKRLEIGAVVAAAPAENVRRERPEDGDIIILLGGRTGRDGCGGATGSSKSHTLASLESCGAEVQKGNAPEERKLQRLFRNKEASLLIKRCNDFGAGGVSVAIGELADGIKIDLNAVPKKYDGLDGTELAISESQERMAVVVEAENVEKFIKLANSENLEATVVAVVQADPRLVMTWNDVEIVNISREFLNSNGAEKHIDITPNNTVDYNKPAENDFVKAYTELAEDLNICSKRGLSERFDSTIGAGTVLMPFGGKNQLTPIQAMVNKVSVETKHTNTCSVMAYGYNPFVSEKSPYHGAYLAVVESVSKLIAAGSKFEDVYLTFQEYFEKPLKDGKRWGKPLSALLGAFMAQKDYEIAAIGGKDSMSGSFENVDVPPTLVSFAVTTENVDNIISPEFKKVGNKVLLVKPEYTNENLPDVKSQKKLFDTVNKLIADKKVVAAYTPAYGGVAEAIMKMSFGNSIGFAYSDDITVEEMFKYNYGAFILETTADVNIGQVIGQTTEEFAISYKNEKIDLNKLLTSYENKLEPIFKCNIKTDNKEIPKLDYVGSNNFKAKTSFAKPKVLIPVFPGTNCEFDTQKVLLDAGAETEIFVINNLSSDNIKESVKSFAEKIKQSQIIFIPGGFSGGDEPDGSGKFITAFFRNGEIKDAVNNLLKNRDGLMCGICNGFQAIIKLGLVPYGEIIDTDENCPTLTYNTISRHQSRIVRTRIASNKSPWLMNTNVGDVYNVAISHGEGRFIADSELIKKLAQNGQIATQYVDLNGNPTSDIHFNPNNSDFAIEGITSPDGRVFGKMGHSERIGYGLYKNVEGNYDMGIFDSAVKYFK